MRTTLELRDDLMRSLLARHPGASKREAVEHAIEVYLAKDATEAVRSLAGAVAVEDVSAELRSRDRHA
jgi:hypothetical protein